MMIRNIEHDIDDFMKVNLLWLPKTHSVSTRYIHDISLSYILERHIGLEEDKQHFAPPSFCKKSATKLVNIVIFGDSGSVELLVRKGSSHL